MENPTHSFREMNLVFQLIQESLHLKAISCIMYYLLSLQIVTQWRLRLTCSHTLIQVESKI